ncbi:GNAT family N-acetyltransferase [Glaciimonas soli]|uniref:GNAT family N-acetyltransferase n=1 Tax=Glaciimonas soli TaxID=2590999 RepID=A0A843YJQ6_9BURK|nr:GNAT family N-acetyltransferase [Glaciimonas soli]MQR00009.1 GNAT family N-acetyltransferase [Glaciimonas soli]
MSSTSDFELREFVADDYQHAFDLWSSIEGLSLHENDTKEAITSFLERNPGFSVVASDKNNNIVGAVLCGHNGRAGSLYHLAVADSARGKGLGRQMVQFCTSKLIEANIPHCSVFVFTNNDVGNQFWINNGWDDPMTREFAWKVLQKRL